MALSRRQLLKRLMLGGVGLSLGSSLSGCLPDDGLVGPLVPPPPKGPYYHGKAPNIVVVLVDDLAARIMGEDSRFAFMREKTPNVRRLEREGVRFANAFVTSSVCSPSRASLLTGTYPHTHGVEVNGVNDLTAKLPNLPGILGEGGYETGFIGKWHMDSRNARPRLGFDYWFSFAGQGVYDDTPVNENGKSYTISGYLTDVLNSKAVDFIQRSRKKPFFMMLSHKACHEPFLPAARHARYFDDARLPEPENYKDDLASKPEWQRRYALCGLGAVSQAACGYVPSSLPAKQWDARQPEYLNYLRTLLAVDEGVGMLLQALQQTEQLDNTLFIFTSDNGSMLGAHGFYDKRVFYEESIRVPLVVRFPKRFPQGVKRDEMVTLLDIGPSLLEVAGLEVPQTMAGASLLPLFAALPAPWREAFFYEYYASEQGPGVPTMLGVRGQRYKYVTYPETDMDISEFYDLDVDPGEMTNAVADPRYAPELAYMQQLLERLKLETGFTPALQERILRPPQAN